MKYSLIIVFLFFKCLNGFSQKNAVTVGTFIPPLSTVIGSYEYRLSTLNNRLGIGLFGLYRNPPRIDAEEFSVGPRLNYFIVNKKSGGVYLGTAGAIGQLNGKQLFDFRLQGGINITITNSFALKLEFSNYMLTDNGVGAIGGIQYAF